MMCSLSCALSSDMPNRKGHPQTLVASHPGNAHHLTSGLCSRSGRVLAPRAHKIGNELMQLPHVHPIDRVAAEEIGSLVARLEAIDKDLDERGHFGRAGAQSLLQYRSRLSGSLQSWLDRFGATPRARADWAARLATAGNGTVAEQLRRRLGELQ